LHGDNSGFYGNNVGFHGDNALCWLQTLPFLGEKVVVFSKGYVDSDKAAC